MGKFQNQVEVHTHGMAKAFLGALMLSLGSILGAAILALFVERMPRRLLLFCALMATGVGVAILGLLKLPDHIIYVLPFVEAVHMGVITVLYAYTPESFPTSIRSFCFGLCSSVHRFAPVISPFVVSALMKYSFQAVATSFGCIFAFGSLLTIALTVETQGKLISDVMH